MIDWLDNHWMGLLGLAFLYLILKGLDQLRNTILAFHDDYRIVNDLNARKAMKMQSEI
jgi:hypothetical protein